MRTWIGWTGRSMQSFATSPAVMMWKADPLSDPKGFSFRVDPFMELSWSGKQDTLMSVLVPELHAGEVVVFDNLSSDLASSVEAAIEEARPEMVRLPPYSSDYTPIEELWSQATQVLRRVAARSRRSLSRSKFRVFPTGVITPDQS